jgi:hypothetical protein
MVFDSFDRPHPWHTIQQWAGGLFCPISSLG